MNNKTTAILTFLVSTVIPFIQEVVDFISAFRTGSYDKSASGALREVAFAMQDDLVNMQKRGKTIDDYAQPVSASSQKEDSSKSWSRFLGQNH